MVFRDEGPLWGVQVVWDGLACVLPGKPFALKAKGPGVATGEVGAVTREVTPVS